MDYTVMLQLLLLVQPLPQIIRVQSLKRPVNTQKRSTNTKKRPTPTQKSITNQIRRPYP